MGLFDIFKTRNDNQEPPTKIVAVDNVLLIDVPTTWNQFESDRFRMRTKDGNVNFAVTNYAKEVPTDHVFTIEDLKRQTLPLFDRFVNEGGYESNSDLEIGDNWIYQSFKVDHETQYYYYTHRLIRSNTFVLSVMILKETGPVNVQTKNLLKAIGESIKHKVADI